MSYRPISVDEIIFVMEDAFLVNVMGRKIWLDKTKVLPKQQDKINHKTSFSDNIFMDRQYLNDIGFFNG